MTHPSSARGLAALAVLGVLALGSTTACASGSTTAAGSSVGSSASGSASTGPSSGTPVPSLLPLPTVTRPAPTGSGTPSGIKATGYSTSNTTLTVSFFAGVCANYSLRADQSTAGEVKVTIIATPTNSTGKMCPQLIKEQSASTDLGSPLDGRKVVDTASGQALPQITVSPLPGGGRVTHGPVKS